MLLRTAFGLALIGAPAAHAQQQPAPQPQKIPDAIYTTFYAASDYRFDGASNSSGEPVLQASLHWWRPDHVFAGVFLTTVDYSGYYDPDTSYEVDVYAGYNFDFGLSYFEMKGDATRLQLQLMYSAFPDQGPPGPTYDFLQAQATLLHRTGDLTLRAQTSYVPEAPYKGGQTLKVEAGAEYKLAGWLTLSGEYGYREARTKVDRSWWDAGATLSFGQFELDLRYYDTDLDYAECGYSANCGSAAVGKISWSPWKG